MLRPLALIVVLFLAGCASDVPATWQVYQLQRQLLEVTGEVEAYEALPECTEGVVVACHDPDAAAQAWDAVIEADAALDQAEAMVRTPGAAPDAINVYVNLARVALARVALYITSRSAS